MEQSNGDFAQTIFRQFLFDSFSCFYYAALMESRDSQVQAIAAKSHKEAAYHVKWSSDWVIRLGDGTEESKTRIQNAVDLLWPYSGELTSASDVDIVAYEKGHGVDLSVVKSKRDELIREVMTKATLTIPSNNFSHTGGKEGKHTEHLGYILADLQFLQRAYPGLEW